jgi:hypothetical protein
MSIIISRLEQVKHRQSGKIIARCPACAEEGRDSKGEHLVVMPCGKFGCIANEGEAGADHRKRIFELAGEVAERVIPSDIAIKLHSRTARTGISKSYAYGKKESPICIRTSVYPSGPSGTRVYGLRVIEYDQPPRMVEIDVETGYPIINGAICPF